MVRLMLLGFLILNLSACASLSDAMSQGTKAGPSKVYKTTQCTVDNPDGVRCDVKTCKADAASDCSMFKEACTEYGHSYEGDASKGTCTRGNGTPT
jgi:hypothetical protein